MKRTTCILVLLLVLIPLGVFFLSETWGALVEHWMVFYKWFVKKYGSYYPWYLWVLSGAVVFPLMNRFWVKNMELTKTFTHELTHTITGLLLFRRIHSFHAEERGSGEVWSSGNDKLRFLMSLAPYCFPIYTFPLLILRCLVTPSLLPIIDILVGFTIGLHIVCFKEQTDSRQPDINQFPLWFSYSYIGEVLIFDVCLILTSYLPKSNIFFAFKTFGVDFWNDVCVIVKTLF